MFFDVESIKTALAKEYDIVVTSHGPIRQFDDKGERTGTASDKKYVTTIQNIVQALKDISLTDKTRLLVVGGAGSLLLPNGEKVEDQPWFPAAVLGEAQQHTEALTFLPTEKDVQWSYLSPPGFFQAGERTGKFALGKDNVVGHNISFEDYAIVLVDEIEKNEHLRERFACAYAA